MITANKDTLAYQLSRPLVQKIDRSDVPCEDVAGACLKYLNEQKGNNAHPETDALWFYMMNHAMAELRTRFGTHEPLGECAWIADTYHMQIAPRALRAFYYLLVICIREARHCKSGASFYDKVGAKFGKAAGQFFKQIKCHPEGGAYNLFLNEPPITSIGPFVEANAYVFYNGSFAGGYGGPAWGNVADCLVRFVKGEFSAEMMMDTVWTLSHNNGPIFNKSMLYHTYSLSHLIRILDVQRSGQIPHLIHDDMAIQQFVTPELSQAWIACFERLGECFGGHVDWFTVEALGSQGKYPADKKQQQAKHGVPEKFQAIVAKKETQLKAKQKADYETWFTVMPGLKLKKVKLARAA